MSFLISDITFLHFLDCDGDFVGIGGAVFAAFANLAVGRGKAVVTLALVAC